MTKNVTIVNILSEEETHFDVATNEYGILSLQDDLSVTAKGELYRRKDNVILGELVEVKKVIVEYITQ